MSGQSEIPTIHFSRILIQQSHYIQTINLDRIINELEAENIFTSTTAQGLKGINDTYEKSRVFTSILQGLRNEKDFMTFLRIIAKERADSEFYDATKTFFSGFTTFPGYEQYATWPNITRKMNQSMIDFMIEARKQNKTMKVRYGRVLFSGSSGAGKTSFYKLLMNRNRSEQHISTGLVQSEQAIAAVKVDAYSKDECVEFCELDIKNEIVKLQSLLNTMAYEQSSKNCNNMDAIFPEQPNNNQMASNNGVKLCGVEIQMATETSSKTELITHPQKMDEMNIFTFMDTGGQPQFISMIPAVNSSAMVTFIVHDLKHNLNDKVIVTHGGKDGKNTLIPYTIGCTNLELIKSLVSFTNNLFLKKKPFLEEICENKGKENVSYLSFIGTHLDEVLPNTTSAQEVDNSLDALLKESGVEHVWMNVNSEYKFLIPVNNLTSEDENEYGTHDSIKEIRKKLYQKILQQEVYNVPIVWLLLELEIRNKCENQKFITYHEIVKLCHEHDLIHKEDDIKNGLRFHHLFGVLLYFDEIPELRDYIFTDYHWLFNNLTKIVYQSYLNYNQDNLKVVTDFKSKGFFIESLLDKCDLKLKHNDESAGEIEIDFKQGFIKLLEYLRIIAPLEQDDSSIIYFMPSILNTCDLRSDHCSIPLGVLPEDAIICDKTEPLLVQFRHCNDDDDRPGSFPRGTFCCLIAELLQDRPKLWHLYWLDNKEKVFDNLVTLLYRPAGQYVTLVDRILYLEIIMLQNHQNVHYDVKKILENALHKIGTKLNFHDFELTFSFICQFCLAGGQHVLLQETSYSVFECYHGHTTQKTSNHTVWDEIPQLHVVTRQSVGITTMDEVVTKRARPLDPEHYIRSNYMKLTNLTISDTLIKRLYKEEVITLDEKMTIGKLEERKRMEYLLDHVIIPSLKCNHTPKYIGFLYVMKSSDDSLLKDVASELMLSVYLNV